MTRLMRSIDPRRRPQDDLYAHVNGSWLDQHDLPAGVHIDGAFRELWNLADNRIQSLIDDDGPDGPLNTLYESINQRVPVDELEPTLALEPDLALVGGLRTPADLATALARLHRVGIHGPFDLAIAYCREQAIYLPKVKISEQWRSADPPSDARAAAANAVLIKLSSTPSTHSVSMTPSRLDVDFPGFAWTTWLRELGVSTDAVPTVVVADQEAIARMVQFMRVLPLRSLEEWVRWRVTSARADHFGLAFGSQSARCVVERFAGPELASRYSKRFTSPSSVSFVVDMFERIRDAFARLIDDSEWCSPSGRRAAIAKLRSVTLWTGTHHSGNSVDLDVRREDPVGNVRRGFESLWNIEVARIGQAFHRGLDANRIYSANGFYDHESRELVIPPGLMNPPFFDLALPDAYNYGAIGVIIGHELAHCLDLVEWGAAAPAEWSTGDEDEFRSRVRCLINQCVAGVPTLTDEEPVLDLAGVLNEVLCDHIGVRIALDALAALRGATDLRHLFFAAWVWTMRAKCDDTEAADRIVRDPHPPADVRCSWVLRNSDAFHDAFGVRRGDRMWIPLDERFVLWGR
ncbi:M13 family metallopeptidase [Antrihabitans spumae]|uniref:M13 family metallopeptidase n=1 Tax=Antrihabitans spumae TaxID=3373370 RepID=A0ABW7KIU6_9NOCA